MILTVCSKCHQLCEVLLADLSDNRQAVCSKCSTITEVLEAADALNRRMRSELDRSGTKKLPFVTVFKKGSIAPLLERSEKAVAKARQQ